MPIHDWTRVPAGIFHDFHHEWISTMKHALNASLLPPTYYALAEQQASGFGPDVITLQSNQPNDEDESSPPSRAGGPAGVLLACPKVRFQAETEKEFLRRRKSTVVIRHVSDDRIIGVVEVVSPGNKAGKNAYKALVDKACEFLEHKIHLLLIDLLPPTKRDPNGLHGAVWEEIADEPFAPPPDKPLTLVAYESDLTVKAYIEPVAVGDILPDMPLFLEPHGCVHVPLEATYREAFGAMPKRWQTVLEPTP
jgi:hypothetical protein